MDETTLYTSLTVPEICYGWNKARATVERQIKITENLVSRRTDKRGGRLVTMDSVIKLWGAPTRSPFDYAGSIEGRR